MSTRYAVIATSEFQDCYGPDASSDAPATRPVGYVANIVIWDGVTPWSPGDGFMARLQTTEQIGDVVSL